MSDNNRLELDIVANDDTGPATGKARANFRSIVQEAAKSAQGINGSMGSAGIGFERTFEQATAKAMRSLDALERRAALAGKSAMEKLYFQRNNPPSNLGDDDRVITRYQSYYDKLIAARRKYEEQMAKMGSSGEHGGLSTMVLRRGFLAVKDFGEGRVQGTMAEAADILFGQGGTGGVVQKFIPQVAELTGLSNGAVIAVGGLAAAFVGLGIAGVESMRGLAEKGEEIKNFSLRTGIAPTRVQAFQYAATATGQDPAIFERMTRGLAQAAEDDSASGTKARKELDQLGVSLYDRFGDLKPTEQIILDLADGLDKLPPGLQRSASSMEIFKRIGVEAIPVLSELRKNLATSDEIGNTFSEHDLAMMERWNDSLKKMGEEFHRFKLQVEVPLGIIGEVTLKGIKFLGIPAAGGIGVGSDYAKQLGEYINSHLFQQGEITPPKPAPDDLRRSAENDLAASARVRLRALEEKDPAFRLAEAKKKLTELRALAEHGSPDAVESAIDQFQLVKRLEDKSGNKGLEGVIAARKQGFDLDAKYAEIQASAVQKRLSASLNTSKELMPPEDIKTRLEMAELTAIAQKDKEIEARRKTIDTKPGFQKFQAAEEATLPKRIRNEYATVLGELEAQDARYFKARNDADGKAWEAAWQRRKKGELDLQDEEIRTRQQIQTHQFDIDGQAIDRQKEMALQGLGLVDAQTLKDKIALEDQKLAIEDAYAERSLVNQVAKLNNQQALEIANIQKRAAADGVDVNSDSVQGDIQATRDKYQQEIDAARGSTTDREIIDAQKAQSAKEKLAIESNRKVYDSLKQDAAGLFDQLVFHTKSWGAFAKDILKATLLTPAKEIFSSQVAGLFTGLLTGQKVDHEEIGNGKGWFGKLGSIAGRAGLGPAKFGDANHPLAKLNAPNHLGDVSLVSGAVPVVIMNAPQVGAAHAQAASASYGSVGASLANSFGAVILSGVRSNQQLGIESPTYGIGEATFIPESLPSGIAQSSVTYGGVSPNGFPTMGDVAALGTPSGIFSAASDNPWVLPTPPPYADPGLSGAQLADWSQPNLGPEAAMAAPRSSGGLSGIANMGMSGMLSHGGLKAFLGQNSLGTDLGNGTAIANTGMMGHLAAFGKSNAAAMIGAGLVMDGLSRKPGKASAVETPLGAGMIGFKLGGTGGGLIGAGIGLGADGLRRGGYKGMMEDAAGGALIGFQVGGPAGAAVGAIIGGAIGTVRMFMESDRDHVKKLVKQVYGMDINNGTADAIIQIAKQKYGGQHDLAIRSPEVRDLLKLYAQANGDKTAEDKFAQEKIHSASLVESGGKLYQQAVYDNGNAYSYSSPLATYGGVNTAPLQTYAPNNGFTGNLQINLNGQSASDALAGQVVKVATPGFVQGRALAASGSSIGRTSQQNMALQPSAISR